MRWRHQLGTLAGWLRGIFSIGLTSFTMNGVVRTFAAVDHPTG